MGRVEVLEVTVPMLVGVFRGIDDLKVLHSVVGLVSIAMVDTLIGFEIAPEMLLHD